MPKTVTLLIYGMPREVVAGEMFTLITGVVWSQNNEARPHDPIYSAFIRTLRITLKP